MSDATLSLGRRTHTSGRQNLSGTKERGATVQGIDVAYIQNSRSPSTRKIHVVLLPKDHIRRALRWLWGFLTCSGRLSGLRVSELGNRSRKRLGRLIVLCSWGKHYTFTVPLSTLEHKWVSANYQEALMKCWGWLEHGLASHPGGE